MLNNTDQKFVG